MPKCLGHGMPAFFAYTPLRRDGHFSRFASNTMRRVSRLGITPFNVSPSRPPARPPSAITPRPATGSPRGADDGLCRHYIAVLFCDMLSRHDECYHAQDEGPLVLNAHTILYHDSQRHTAPMIIILIDRRQNDGCLLLLIWLAISPQIYDMPCRSMGFLGTPREQEAHDSGYDRRLYADISVYYATQVLHARPENFSMQNYDLPLFTGCQPSYFEYFSPHRGEGIPCSRSQQHHGSPVCRFTSRLV